MQNRRDAGCLRGQYSLLIAALVGFYSNRAWAQPLDPRPAETRAGNVVDYRAQEQRSVLPSPEIPHGGEEGPPSSVDPAQSPASAPPAARATGLWKLLRQQRYQNLRQELRRLRRNDRRWRPPQKLLSLLAAGETRQVIERAIATQAWDHVLALSRRYPGQFTCAQISHLWALADAHRAHDQAGAQLSVYEYIIAKCQNTAARLATLEKAREQLSPEAMESLLQREARVAKDEEAQSQFTDIRYRFYAGRLSATFQSKEVGTALLYEERLRAEVQNRRDVNIALLLGWSHFHAHQLAQAAAWFTQAATWDGQREDAVYGLALTQFAQGRLREAEDLLRRGADASAKMRDLLGEVLLARARVSRENKEFRESLALAQESEQYRPPGRDTHILKAWNMYDLGETAQAAEEFAALYQSHADDETAQGVLYSYTRARDWEGLERVARSVPGPLTSLWSAQAGQRNYEHKLFLLAHQAAPDTFPQLRNLESPAVTSGVVLRRKSGDTGLGKLEEENLPLVEGDLVYEEVHRLSFHLSRVTLDSGRLPPHARIGDLPRAPTAFSFRPTTRLTEGLEPRLTYTFTGWLTPYAELGWTPTDGVVPGKPTWRLGMVHRQEHGQWSIEAFSQSVKESLLSYTGLRDPYSGRRWGQVRQTGVRLSIFTEVMKDWGASGHISIAMLRGQGVSNNYHVGLGIGLARAFKPHGFDYLAVGPRLRFDHYQKNLSHFTIGQGGYFSPHHLIQFGAAVSFLTQEASQFIIMGDLSAGVQVHREESSPFFPRRPDGRRYAASTESGPVFSAELTSVWQLSSHWQLGGGGIVRKTANYDDQAVMFFARFLFDPRAVVVSTDIPRHLLQALY